MSDDLEKAMRVVKSFTGTPWLPEDICAQGPSPLMDGAIATILNAVVSGALVRSDLCASGQVRALMEAADRDADRCAGQIAELEAALEKARAEAAPDDRSADMAECFMFSVGYEAGESDGRAAAIKQAGIQRENGDHNQAPLDQAQQPAAEVGPDPMCPDCKGTGERDSSGTHPWGAPAMAPCDCDKSRVSVADHPDFARVGDSLYDAGYKAGWNAALRALKGGDANV